MHRRNVVVVAVATVALSACAMGTTQATQTPVPLASAWRPGLLVDGYGPVGLGPRVTSSASASGDPSASVDPVQQALASVSLQQSDFGTGLTVQLATDGTSLDQASLAYCGAAFASEAARDARRRTTVVPSSDVDVSSEAVYYRSPDDGAAALAQLRAAARACPTHRTATSGTQTLVLDVVPSDAVDLTGLVAEPQRLVVATTIDTGSGTPYRLTRVWQQRGRVLVGVFYGGATTAFTDSDRSNLHVLTSGVAEHLGALTSSFTGTG